MESGDVVYSPISQNHNIKKYLTIKNELSFWLDQDLTILAKCDELYIVKINEDFGDKLIKDSPGCQAELEYAAENSIHIKIKEYICKIQEDTRSYNVGESDYSKYKIQPWDIWLEYDLNPWDADIVKRVLRTKKGDRRELDYEKIIHLCKERIRQIELKNRYERS